MFESISIIGRVAYGLYALETYLKKTGENLADWDILLEKLWSFPEFEFMDDYTDFFIEHLPSAILEFETYLQGDEWEYVSEDEYAALKQLYTHYENIENIETILQLIENMLSVHLYTTIKIPAKASLDIMNMELYPFLQRILKQVPTVKPFQLYSITESDCWGEFYPKEELLASM